jgi:hypothetical protein
MTSVALMVEGSDTQSLRERLHVEHHARHAAETNLAACQRALARGEEMVREAQSEINKLEEAQHEIAAAHAQRLADQAAGRPVAPLRDEASSADRMRWRQEAGQRLADASWAAGLLRREAEAANSDLAAALRRIDAAIAALLLDWGERMAVELRAAEGISLHLRRGLTALAGMWLTAAGQPARIRMGPQAAKTINSLPLNDDRYPQQNPAHLSPIAGFARDWRRTIEALRVDPDVPLPSVGDS